MRLSPISLLLLCPLSAHADGDANTAVALVDSSSLRASVGMKLQQSTAATPMNPSSPNACSGVGNGGNPKIKTDIYYILEYTRDGTTRCKKETCVLYGINQTNTQPPDMAQGDPNTARDWTERLFTPHLPLKEFDTNDRADPAIHFRFEAGAGNSYHMVNGKSGQWVITERDPRTSDHILATTGAWTDFSMSTCDANGYITISQVGLYQGFIRYHRERWQFAVTAQQWGEEMTTSCCDSCPAGWTRTSENTMACVFCDTETCWHLTGPYDYQKAPVKFKLYESPAFYAPDVINGPQQTVATDPAVKYIATAGIIMKSGISVLSNTISYGSWTLVAGQIVNKFGTLARAASIGLGVLGIALQIAVDMAQPSVQEQLAQLEQKIMTAVGNLVSDAVVGMAVQQASNFFKTARFRLNTEVKSAKKVDFTANDLTEIDDDAGIVSSIAFSINGGLDLIKPAGIAEPYPGDRSATINNPSITDTTTNVKLIQQGYLMYVSGVMDMISALSEVVMLTAYAHPETSCDDIIATSGLATNADRQGFFLEQMASFIANRRTRPIVNNKNPGKYTGWTARDTFTSQDLYYTGNDNNKGTGDTVDSLRIKEIQWDMNTYSYRFTAVRESLKQIVANTKTLCGLMRTDAGFKADYVNCAKGIGSGCA